MPKPTSPPQLDIFEHSADVMCRNDVIYALLRHDAPESLAACERLAAVCRSGHGLPAMRLLADALHRQEATPLTDPDAVARERCRLTDVIAPAATQTFNSADAETFMRPWWRLLAERSNGVPYRAFHVEDHAAAHWLRSESWAHAVRTVERIESWRRIPAPLAWMIEARCRLGELGECWALLAELAWLSPRRFEDVVRCARDPLLTRLHKKFGSSFDGHGDLDDLAWFPAWVLTEAPALVGKLSLAMASQNTPPERGMRLMVELLGLERQGRHSEVIERRRALRDLSLPLWTAYMAQR